MVMALVSTVADAAIAAAMISPCTSRLCTRASIRPARNCDRYRMPTTSASRPATLRNRMRRVRLEKLWVRKNCHARRGKPLRPTATASSAGAFASAMVDDASAVRSSTWSRQSVSCTLRLARFDSIPQWRRSRQGPSRSGLLEPVADAVECLDHVERFVDRLELLAQPLDVAVDRAVVDIDLIVVGGIHQRVATLDHARPARQRLQDQELGHRQGHGLALPGADVTLRVHAQ